MKSTLDCIPCFVRQALEAARFVSDDPAVHEQALREVLRLTLEMDFNQSPPLIGQRIHRHLREITGNEDPYRSVKDRFNRLALTMFDGLSRDLQAAAEPLTLAVKLAIAGNVIDHAINGDLSEEHVRRAIEQTVSQPLVGNIDLFRQGISEAASILYLADNAGEIVFDRLLIEQMPFERVTLAVRGVPVINDATHADAHTAGLDRLVEVIDNGSDAPGTVLSDCSAEFRDRFARADLIVAKGQGNFETLSDVASNIFFLFKAKCPVIARHVDVPLGGLILARQGDSISV